MIDNMTSLKEFCESKTTLYVTHRDSEARIKGSALVYTNNKTGISTRVEMSDIRRVVFMGIPGFSGEIMYRFCKANIPVDFMDLKGNPLGQLLTYNTDAAENNVLLQECFIKTERPLDLARELLLNKIDNCAEIIRQKVKADKMPDFSRFRHMMLKAKTADELRGAEGISAKYYFKEWNDLICDFKWEGRLYHPSSDPVNTMLSVGYTLLYNRMVSALRCVGLNPKIGFFHLIRGRHAALASDLMEPFRSLIDGAVLKMIRLKMIKPEQFSVTNGRCSFSDYEAYRTLLKGFESMFAKECRLFCKKNDRWIASIRKVNDHIDDLAFSYVNYIKTGTPLHATRIKPCKDF